jgi:hypothetical protein
MTFLRVLLVILTRAWHVMVFAFSCLLIDKRIETPVLRRHETERAFLGRGPKV